MRSLGIDQLALKAESGTVFAVRRVEADYLSPARFDDQLEVQTSIHATTPARITLNQDVLRSETVLFSALVTLVAMDGAGRPQRLPAALRRASV